MNSNEIKAGSKVVMTHSQRQAFLKKSSLGKLLGVSHLLPEVEQETNTKNIAVITKEVISLHSVKSEGRKEYRQSLRSYGRQLRRNCKYIVKASSKR